MSSTRNGHPTPGDTLDALRSYTAHRVAVVKRKVDEMRPGDEADLQRELDAISNVVQIIGNQEDTDMKTATDKPAPPNGAPRPTPLQVAKARQAEVDRAIQQSVTTWPIQPPPLPRWSLIRLPDGAGEVHPPPQINISAAEYAAFNRQADDAEQALVQQIREQAGRLPQAKTCQESAARVDAVLRQLATLKDQEADAATSIRHALKSGKVDKLPRLAETRNSAARQIEVVEAELPHLQRQHVELCQGLMQSVRRVAQQVCAEARGRLDQEQRGWARDETLTQILARVCPSAILSGRVGGPHWPEAQAVQAAESILGGSLPPASPPPLPTPAPVRRPDFGTQPVEMRMR
jgi:hypothetical protein